MEEWKHTILLLSGGKEGQMGEKCSVATEEAGMENDATFANWNLTVSTVSGRKINIIMMHEDVELSASERMARGSSPLIVSKQHSKNIHVFTCMIKCLERLPFDQEHQKNQLCIMLMDWIGKLAPLLCSISFHSQALFFWLCGKTRDTQVKARRHFVAVHVGNLYISTSFADLRNLPKTLGLWKIFALQSKIPLY